MSVLLPNNPFVRRFRSRLLLIFIGGAAVWSVALGKEAYKILVHPRVPAGVALKDAIRDNYISFWQSGYQRLQCNMKLLGTAELASAHPDFAKLSAPDQLAWRARQADFVIEKKDGRLAISITYIPVTQLSLPMKEKIDLPRLALFEEKTTGSLKSFLELSYLYGPDQFYKDGRIVGKWDRNFTWEDKEGRRMVLSRDLTQLDLDSEIDSLSATVTFSEGPNGKLLPSGFEGMGKDGGRTDNNSLQFLPAEHALVPAAYGLKLPPYALGAHRKNSDLVFPITDCRLQ